MATSATTSKGNTAYVSSCKCSHEFQDMFYGRGLRLFNKTEQKGAGDNMVKCRCTVCLSVKDIKR
jgi:hypothetical protein